MTMLALFTLAAETERNCDGKKSFQLFCLCVCGVEKKSTKIKPEANLKIRKRKLVSENE